MRQTLRRSGSNVSFFAFQDIITSVIGILIFISLLLALFISSAPLIEPTVAPRQEASPESVQALDSLLQEIADLEMQIQSAKISTAVVTEFEVEALQKELQHIMGQMRQIPTGGPRQEAASEITENIAILQGQITALQNRNSTLQAEVLAEQRELDALQEKLEQALQAKLQVEAKENEMFLIPERDTSTKSPVLLDVQQNTVILQTLDGRKDQAQGVSQSAMSTMLQNFPPKDYFVVAYFRPSSFQHFEDFIKLLRSLSYELGYDIVKEEQILLFGSPSQP